MEIGFKKLSNTAIVPTRGSPGANCYDLYYSGDCVVELKQGMVSKLPTGISLEFPAPHMGKIPGGRICPRSSFGAKGISVLAGMVDNDYRGEIFVLLINHTAFPVIINPGDRVAQLEVFMTYEANFVEKDVLGSTHRGAGAFGSTGK